MRPYLVIFLTPTLYQDLGLLQGIEDLTVEQLIPQLSIKTLVVAILPGTPRFNLERLDPHSA
jgi:hypothetical protein